MGKSGHSPIPQCREGMNPSGVRSEDRSSREVTRVDTREMHTSMARLPKKLTFEPGDYVLKSSRRNI